MKRIQCRETPGQARPEDGAQKPRPKDRLRSETQKFSAIVESHWQAVHPQYGMCTFTHYSTTLANWLLNIGILEQF
jgi:hypothetical protein